MFVPNGISGGLGTLKSARFKMSQEHQQFNILNNKNAVNPIALETLSGQRYFGND